MNWMNRTFTALIVLGLGIGTGLRAPRSPVDVPKPEPLPMHEQKPDPSRSVQPAVEDRAITNAPSDKRLFKAICLWEGRGKIDLDAFNKSEEAHGPAQIRPGYLKDSNEYLKTSYTLQDCHDYAIAFQVTKGYWARYGAKTPEQKARMHNGGLYGHQRKATLKYWAGVQTYLERN